MEIPSYLHDLVAEQINIGTIEANRRSWWATILRLQPMLDGDKWCVLWGPNIQEGIAAFGDSPQDAMWNFEAEMRKKVEEG